jgi:hypothetical protein
LKAIIASLPIPPQWRLAIEGVNLSVEYLLPAILDAFQTTSHFYDPWTGKGLSISKEHALERAIQLFNEAVEEFERNEKTIAHLLGLR